MIKKEQIIATGVYQKMVTIPYQGSLLISVPSSNTAGITLAESKNPTSSEIFELGAGQSISIEWQASRKENNFRVAGQSGDSYQLITV